MKILFQISSILIAFLFVYAINFKSVLTINYLCNQSAIAEAFCVNKEKPQLQCNGKCHLAKQLEQVIDNDQDVPFTPQQNSIHLEINPLLTTTDVEPVNPERVFFQPKDLDSQDKLCMGFTSILSPPPKV